MLRVHNLEAEWLIEDAIDALYVVHGKRHPVAYATKALANRKEAVGKIDTLLTWRGDHDTTSEAAAELTAVWAAAWSRARTGTRPHSAVLARVTESASEVARGATTPEAWQAARRAAEEAGAVGIYSLVLHLSDRHRDQRAYETARAAEEARRGNA